MTFPSEQADALLRPGIQRAAAWLTLTMVTVIFVTTALLVWAAKPGILAERDRAFKRDSTLITENLASVLHLPATGPAPQSQPSVFLTPTSAELLGFLRAHSALISLTALDEDLSVLSHASNGDTDVARVVAAFKSRQFKGFPPKDSEVSMVVDGERLLTAGRISEEPGSGGPLLVLEFDGGGQFNVTHLMLYVVSFTVLTGLLIWAMLNHALLVLVRRPVAALVTFRSRLHQGDWSNRIQPDGTREVQRFQELTNQAVDRVHKLWETIQWRAKHLERLDPSRQSELNQLLAEAAGSNRFGSSQSALTANPRKARVLVVGVVLMMELAALLSIIGEAHSSKMTETWFNASLAALLLGATGLGYVVGHGLSFNALDRSRFKALAFVLVLVSAIAYALATALATDAMTLIAARAVAAICAATFLSSWRAHVSSSSMATGASPGSWLTACVLTAIALAHVLDLSVNQTSPAARYFGLSLVALALTAGALLPRSQTSTAVGTVVLMAIALSGPAVAAFHFGGSLTIGVLKIVTTPSLALIAASALAVIALQRSDSSGMDRAQSSPTMVAIGTALSGAAAIFELRAINLLPPEGWVLVSMAGIVSCQWTINARRSLPR